MRGPAPCAMVRSCMALGRPRSSVNPYGGQRVSTLWSAVHTQMPMTAPGSVSVRDSIDIMAFLLQQNGVAAGATPLDDSVDLTKVLPPH